VPGDPFCLDFSIPPPFLFPAIPLASHLSHLLRLAAVYY